MSAPPPQQYLAPSFDPSTLRMTQLRSILMANGVGAPSTARKADLIAMFELEIRPRAAGIMSAAAPVRPSSQGIVHIGEDGEVIAASTSSRTSASETPPIATGVPVKRPRGRPGKAKVATVALPVLGPVVVATTTDGAEADDDNVPEQPRPVRGRKSAATPSRTSRRSSAVPVSVPFAAVEVFAEDARGRVIHASEQIVIEETEPELDEDVDVEEKQIKGKAKVSKADKLESAAEASRATATEVKTPKRAQGSRPRKSAPATVPNPVTEAEDTGFSDYNPFQSGGESREEKKRRKSSMGARRQTIQAESNKAFRSPEASPVPLPSASVDTGAPAQGSSPSVKAPALRKFQPSLDQLKTPPREVKDLIKASRSPEASNYDDYNQAVHAKLNQISSKGLSPSPGVVVENTVGERAVALRQKVTAPRSAIPLSLIFITLLSVLANYKSQSASIGYCDTASTTNDVIIHRQVAHRRAKECIARRAAITMGERGDGYLLAKNERCDPSALPLVPFLPRPDMCAVCPPHAVCEHGEMIACDSEYLQAPHPLSIFSPAFDGLPGVGPRAFPDRCKPDTVKRRLVGGLARELEAELAKGRGSVVCAGLGGDEAGRAGEGERYGVMERTLIERFAPRRDPKFSEEQFLEVFEAALKDLVEHGDVVESIDVHGTSWYAASRAEIPLGCRAKLAVKDQVEAWKSQLSATMIVLAAIAAARNAMKTRSEEKQIVDDLVKQVLVQLQEQERQHYVDPVSTPQSFIPPPQLRDQLLVGHKNRNHLWRKVVQAVEANANVASRERELKGEVWSTWEWQGRHVTWE